MWAEKLFHEWKYFLIPETFWLSAYLCRESISRKCPIRDWKDLPSPIRVYLLGSRVTEIEQNQIQRPPRVVKGPLVPKNPPRGEWRFQPLVVDAHWVDGRLSTTRSASVVDAQHRVYLRVAFGHCGQLLHGTRGCHHSTCRGPRDHRIACDLHAIRRLPPICLVWSTLCRLFDVCADGLRLLIESKHF